MGDYGPRREKKMHEAIPGPIPVLSLTVGNMSPTLRQRREKLRELEEDPNALNQALNNKEGLGIQASEGPTKQVNESSV